MSIIESGERKEVECPECGNQYKGIGVHWSRGSCDYPEFSDRQLELLKGLCLGDGYIDDRDGQKSCFRVGSVNPSFLSWLDDQFGILSSGVRLAADKETRKANFQGNPQWEDCNFKDVYRLRLWTHPTFDELRKKWYPDGNIRFPSDLELTPESLRMWYCSDGGLGWTDETAYPVISCVNEQYRSGFIMDRFDEIGFNITYSSDSIRIKTGDTEDFFEYIGNPISGMEYKWSYYDEGMYDHMKP